MVAMDKEDLDPPHVPALLTIEETGRRMSLSRGTVQQLVASGQLASLKIGRARRVLASSLEDFIAARIEGAA